MPIISQFYGIIITMYFDDSSKHHLPHIHARYKGENNMCYITPDILEVKALREYYIYLKFKTGEEKVYDMTPCIKKIEYYNKLKNREYFEKVKPRGETVEWEEGEDVCPENLYYDSIDYKEFIEK